MNYRLTKHDHPSAASKQIFGHQGGVPIKMEVIAEHVLILWEIDPKHEASSLPGLKLTKDETTAS